MTDEQFAEVKAFFTVMCIAMGVIIAILITK